MQKAITLSQMNGSTVKDEDLDNLINKLWNINSLKKHRG